MNSLSLPTMLCLIQHITILPQIHYIHINHKIILDQGQDMLGP